MKEGFLKNFKDKHLFIVNSLGKPIYDISTLKYNLTITTIINGTDEASFNIDYDSNYKEIFSKIGKDTFYLLEDYGYLITTAYSEVDDGLKTTISISCKTEDCLLNDRTITLVKTDNSNYAKLPLYTTDGTDNLLGKLFGANGEMPSWNVGTIDSEITTKPYTFKDIKKNNLSNFVYQNIEQTFDVIPFFDSLKHTVSFKKYTNAIDDTGIILAMDTLISEFGKECVTDTYCTRMYVEGGNNLDIRRVNPDGGNYVYDYSKVYDEMSDTLKIHLQQWLAKCNEYKEDYKVKFAEWSEVKIKVETLQTEVDALEQENILWSDKNAFYTKVWRESGDKTGLNQVLGDYEDWCNETGFYRKMADLEVLKSDERQKKVAVTQINNLCKKSNFLTHEDLIELDKFERDKPYKQDAFAKIDGMTETEVGDISSLLAYYAQEELDRCNRPRFNFTVKMNNFCTIKGCEGFASQLDVGKYITVLDGKNNAYKIIVVKIEVNQDNPESITVTFSDKMTGHEHFPLLNEYLNNYAKTIEAQQALEDKLNQANLRMDDIDTSIDNVNNRVTSLIDTIPDLLKTSGTGGNADPCKSIEFYNDGFGYNKTRGYQWLANGNILGVADNMTIPITKYTDSVLKYIKKKENTSGGTTNP